MTLRTFMRKLREGMFINKAELTNLISYIQEEETKDDVPYIKGMEIVGERGDREIHLIRAAPPGPPDPKGRIQCTLKAIWTEGNSRFKEFERTQNDA